MTDFLDEMQDDISNAQQKLDFLKTIKEKYPFVKKDRDRWGAIRYYSKEVNPEVEDVDLHHSCGCCSDAGLLARPYKVINGLRLYSDPCSFCVGHGYEFGDFDVPQDGWREKMEQAGIPQPILQKIDKHFEEEAEKERLYYEDEDEDEDE